MLPPPLLILYGLLANVSNAKSGHLLRGLPKEFDRVG
jgi:hypothetical protein